MTSIRAAARWSPPHRSVPLGRRQLFADRRRLAAGVLATGLAVMLILLLEGMWAGLQAQATVYPDRVGADLYVLQPGVRDLTAGASTLPLSALAQAQAAPGVAWAAPVRTASVILQLHGQKVATSLVGSVPGQPGGPWSLAAGRSPARTNEITVGEVLAHRHGIHLGETLPLLGRTFTVVGLSRSTGFMIDYAFVTHAALDPPPGAPDTTSAVLIGTQHPAAVVQRLRAEGLNVLTRRQVAANNLAFATSIFGSPIRLMVGIGFVGGTLIIALIAYSAVIERRRDYGVVVALGAGKTRLVRLALLQTGVLAGLGVAAGLALFAAGRAVIGATRPQFLILLTADSLGRAVLAAAAMALLAAAVPAWQLSRIDPAAAYRSP